MKLLLLCALCAVVLADDPAPGFRVKYGIGFGFGEDYAFKIDQEQSAITRSGYVQVERYPNALLPSLKLFCPKNDYTYCFLFDDAGFISGIQLAIDVTKYTNTHPSDLSKLGFFKWTPKALPGEAVATYWVNQVFFVNEETLKLSAAERKAKRPNGQVNYAGGVWTQGFDGKSLIHIPGTETEVAKTKFKIQACFPGMGLHYYYDLTENSDCENIYPWFGLYENGKMIGCGFKTYGVYTRPGSDKRDWFENSNKIATRLITPHAPSCLFDNTENSITTHIYFIDNPWDVLCGITDLKYYFSQG